MSTSSSLDVRLAIGALFTALGLLLAGYGVATAGDAAAQVRPQTVNINLWWGLVMLVFGLVLLLAGWRGRQSFSGSGTAPGAEGLATEMRERRLGLESRPSGDS
jgi:hypothetical protein